MNELKYAFFIGCVIPYREVSYEVSTRRVAKELGIELKDMPDYNCCGLPIEPVNHDMMLVLAARNLSIAEEMGLNIMTICNGCTGVLMKVNELLKKERKMRVKVNKYLNEIGMEFKGVIKVEHFAQVLTENMGYDNIIKFVSKPLKSIKIAGYHGCHIFRPSKYLKPTERENPTILNRLIDVTGATRVNYLDQLQCCGLPCGSVDSKIPLFLSREKLKNVKEAGADAIVTLCPSCHIALDTNQPMIERQFSETYQIPVLHYPQLLGLAIGIKPEELEMNKMRVKPTQILKLLA